MGHVSGRDASARLLAGVGPDKALGPCPPELPAPRPSGFAWPDPPPVHGRRHRAASDEDVAERQVEVGERYLAGQSPSSIAEALAVEEKTVIRDLVRIGVRARPGAATPAQLRGTSTAPPAAEPTVLARHQPPPVQTIQLPPPPPDPAQYDPPRCDADRPVKAGYEYDPMVVETVRALYRQGSTQAQVAAAIARSQVWVSTLMRRCDIPRRTAGARPLPAPKLPPLPSPPDVGASPPAANPAPVVAALADFPWQDAYQQVLTIEALSRLLARWIAETAEFCGVHVDRNPSP
jgi:DNA-binding CsgD family transcriptional regulator